MIKVQLQLWVPFNPLAFEQFDGRFLSTFWLMMIFFASQKTLSLSLSVKESDSSLSQICYLIRMILSFSPLINTPPNQKKKKSLLLLSRTSNWAYSLIFSF